MFRSIIYFMLFLYFSVIFICFLESSHVETVEIGKKISKDRIVLKLKSKQDIFLFYNPKVGFVIDTNLYRDAANILRTDDSMNFERRK